MSERVNTFANTQDPPLFTTRLRTEKPVEAETITGLVLKASCQCVLKSLKWAFKTSVQ